MTFEASLARAQRLVLLALAALVPVVFVTAGSDAFQLPKATLTVVGGIVLAALGGARAAAEGSRERWWSRAVLPGAVLALFSAGLLVATAFSEDRMVSLAGWHFAFTGLATYLSLVVIAVSVAGNLDARDLLAVARVATAVASVVVAYGLLQAIGRDPLDWRPGAHPVFSTMGNANFFAGWVAIAVPLLLGATATSALDRPWRIGAAAVSVGGMLAALAARSYQGPLALAVGVAVVAALIGGAGAGRKPSTSTLLGTAIGALAVAAVGAVLLWNRVGGGISDGLRPRRDYWRVALSLFGERPVVGTGLDTFPLHYFERRSAATAVAGFELADAPHNVPLAMLSGGGVVLGIAYAAVIVLGVVAFVRAWRATDGLYRPLLAGCIGAWAAYQVQSFVSIDVPALALMHWLLLGVALALAWPRVAIAEGRDRARRSRRATRRRPLTTGQQLAVAGLGLSALVGATLATRPMRADLHARAAFDALRQGDLPAALERTDRAVSLVPWRGVYRIDRASILERMDRRAEALASAEAAAGRDPGGNVAMLAGRYAAAGDQRERAVRWFREAARRDPRNPHLLRDAGIALLDLGEAEAALPLLRRATSGLPALADAWMALGRAYAQQSRYDEAEEAYERALALEPGDARVEEALSQLRAARSARRAGPA